MSNPHTFSGGADPAARDPRKNPRRGDVLESKTVLYGWTTFYIDDVDMSRREVVYRENSNPEEMRHDLDDWLKCSATDKVLHVADDGASDGPAPVKP
mgnify:CR=1 FL=1